MWQSLTIFTGRSLFPAAVGVFWWSFVPPSWVLAVQDTEGCHLRGHYWACVYRIAVSQRHFNDISLHNYASAISWSYHANLDINFVSRAMKGDTEAGYRPVSPAWAVPGLGMPYILMLAPRGQLPFLERSLSWNLPLLLSLNPSENI